jgi:2-amino-4-hydroxy-6-hydroxymethyldihydropteridine diphosphokinase
MAKVYIGIGSNIGKREYNCKKAIQKIEGKGIRVKKISSMYETKPWGFKEQPLFINMVIEVETEINPYELLKILKQIETEMGRKETIRWGPRIIDLDILLYNNEIIDREDLKIPHPFLHQRDFVLLPLSEIAPETIHPILKKTIKQLKEELIDKDIEH